jgi:hypothetical protein
MKKKSKSTMFTGRSTRPATVATDDRVSHKLFGEGVVLNVRMACNSEYYYVDTEFDDAVGHPEGNTPTRLRTMRDDFLEKIKSPAPIEEDTINLGEAEGDVVPIGAK